MSIRAVNNLARAGLCALSFTFTVGNYQTDARGQRPPPPAPQKGKLSPPRRKKLPPGARGFNQYAVRDASDKLAVGAATRGRGARALIADGLARYKQDDLAGAAKLFKRAVRLEPDNAQAHYSLGIVLGELDRYEESAAEFRQALGCGPDDEQRLLATFNLGNAYLDMGRYREALARFREAARLDPQLETAHYNMGLTYVALKDLGSAVEAFAQAVRLKNDYADARFNLALALWRSGRREEARSEQGRLMRLDAARAARLGQLFK